MGWVFHKSKDRWVTPRMRRVSRNLEDTAKAIPPNVTPRMRRVSRNNRISAAWSRLTRVTPRMRRVSRNFNMSKLFFERLRHAVHEACE